MQQQFFDKFYLFIKMSFYRYIFQNFYRSIVPETIKCDEGINKNNICYIFLQANKKYWRYYLVGWMNKLQK